MNGFEMILPFLKPIEHLILDETISEVMVNGPNHVFIERDGFIEEVRGLSLGDKSLMIAVKNIGIFAQRKSCFSVIFGTSGLMISTTNTELVAVNALSITE